MEQIKNSALRFGIWPPPGGSIDFHSDDWTSVQHVPFAPFLPPPKPGSQKGVHQRISVIVTPNQNVTRPDIAPVPVVLDVTQGGFSFRARNTSPRSADTSGLSFSWLAALNISDVLASKIDVRTEIGQPKETSGFLDSASWPRLWFSTPHAGAPVVLLTENSPRLTREATPALVGFVGQLEGMPLPLPTDGMSIHAVNVDTAGGRAGFNAVAIARGVTGVPPPVAENMWLDHGSEENADDYFKANAFPNPNTPPYPINRGGAPGDWVGLDIYFDRPFLAPPLVLATARKPVNTTVTGTPIVPVAHNVTTHGFTLAARNTDSVAGFVGFYWVAIGCNEGCV